MSILHDRANEIAYARAGRSLSICRCDRCEEATEPPCELCGEDCVRLDEAGHCAKCAADLKEVEE